MLSMKREGRGGWRKSQRRPSIPLARMLRKYAQETEPLNS